MQVRGGLPVPLPAALQALRGEGGTLGRAGQEPLPEERTLRSQAGCGGPASAQGPHPGAVGAPSGPGRPGLACPWVWREGGGHQSVVGPWEGGAARQGRGSWPHRAEWIRTRTHFLRGSSSNPGSPGAMTRALQHNSLPDPAPPPITAAAIFPTHQCPPPEFHRTPLRPPLSWDLSPAALTSFPPQLRLQPCPLGHTHIVGDAQLVGHYVTKPALRRQLHDGHRKEAGWPQSRGPSWPFLASGLVAGSGPRGERALASSVPRGSCAQDKSHAGPSPLAWRLSSGHSVYPQEWQPLPGHVELQGTGGAGSPADLPMAARASGVGPVCWPSLPSLGPASPQDLL